jgi:hypothetical protein
VVMGFPAVWAAAMVGTHTEGTATIVVAIAATIKSFARWARRILGHLPLRDESCLAQRDLRCQPVNSHKKAGLTSQPGDSFKRA